MSQYRKFIVAVIGALAVIGAEIPADAPDWLTGAAAAAAAAGVFLVRNDPPARHGPREKFRRQPGVGGYASGETPASELQPPADSPPLAGP